MKSTQSVKDALFGACVGDALGVPYEFKDRSYFEGHKVTEMVGFKVWNQPAGTWSDDSSLMFCLAESLSKDFDFEKISDEMESEDQPFLTEFLADIATNFAKRQREAYWTPHGRVFDIGIQTACAIGNLQKILDDQDFDALHLLHLEPSERSNGNGSLMRILPLVFVFQYFSLEEQFLLTWKVSALTHPHPRSAIACFFYLKYAEGLLLGQDRQSAYSQTQSMLLEWFGAHREFEEEKPHFGRILEEKISDLPREEIKSFGYVMQALEASLWCFLNTDSYQEAVVSAVELGGDTDTTACITGGLAGLYYGFEAIPGEWTSPLAKLSEIEGLGERVTFMQASLQEKEIDGGGNNDLER